jgi:hypothetical protein
MHLLRGAIGAAAALALTAIACDSGSSQPTTGGPSCLDTLQTAGIVVDIRDARTSDPAALGATGTVEDGAYMENLVPFGTAAPGVLLSLAGAFNRAGTYDVQVHKSGYLDWSAPGVRVLEGACGVIPVPLTANLTRVN